MNFLRSFLLNLFCGPMLCFAAGDAAVGGGGGEGTGGGAGEGGGGGSAPPIATWGPPKEGTKPSDVVDHGKREAVGDKKDGDDTGTEFNDDVDALDADDNTRSDVEDAQTFKQFLDSIKAGIVSEDPAVAKKAEKQLKKIYGENQQYREHFETPEAAREVSERLESLGGLEGIETETGEAATLWNMLGAGDPAILDTLEKDHGGGLIKLFGPYVDRMAQKAPGVYAHKFAKVFMATMNEAPAGGISALAALNGLMKIDKVKDSPEFQRVAEVVNRINEIASQAPKESEGSDNLTARERKLQQQERDLKTQALSGKAAPILSRSARSAIESRLNGKKLGPEAMKQVTAWAHEEFAKLAAKDATAKKNREALLASGEHDKWLRQVKSVAQRLMPLAAKAALRKYSGISGNSGSDKEQRRAEGNSRREAGGGGTSAGVIRTKEAPDPKTVDWERMKIEAKKNGKDVEDMFTFDRAYFKKGDTRNLYRY